MTNDEFEAAAAQFYHETGYMAPGKDAPAGGFNNDLTERRVAWNVWTMMRSKVMALSGALQEIGTEARTMASLMPSGERPHDSFSLIEGKAMAAYAAVHCWP